MQNHFQNESEEIGVNVHHHEIEIAAHRMISVSHCIPYDCSLQFNIEILPKGMGLPLFFTSSQERKPVKFTFSERDIQKFKRKLERGAGRAPTFRSWFNLSSPLSYSETLIDKQNEEALKMYTKTIQNQYKSPSEHDPNLSALDLEHQPLTQTPSQKFIAPKINLDLIPEMNSNTLVACEHLSVPVEHSLNTYEDSMNRISNIFLVLMVFCCAAVVSTMVFMQQSPLVASGITLALVVVICVLFACIHQHNKS